MNLAKDPPKWLGVLRLRSIHVALPMFLVTANKFDIDLIMTIG